MNNTNDSNDLTSIQTEKFKKNHSIKNQKKNCTKTMVFSAVVAHNLLKKAKEMYLMYYYVINLNIA